MTSPWFCASCDYWVPLPHQCPKLPRPIPSTLLPHSRPAEALVSYQLTSAVLSAVEESIAELQAGEHASASRDFGRGVAHATRVIAGAVAAAIEINLNPLPEEFA